jgi:hypothetical protein
MSIDCSRRGCSTPRSPASDTSSGVLENATKRGSRSCSAWPHLLIKEEADLVAGIEEVAILGLPVVVGGEALQVEPGQQLVHLARRRSHAPVATKPPWWK